MRNTINNTDSTLWCEIIRRNKRINKRNLAKKRNKVILLQYKSNFERVFHGMDLNVSLEQLARLNRILNNLK